MQAREQLANLEPGGAPERPIEVTTAALVEPRAESLRCTACEGPLRAVEHDTCEHAGELLRVVLASCRDCGKQRRAYFRVRAALAN